MVTLGEEGKKDVCVDDVFGMTPGTLKALCTDFRRFVSNESGFVPVKSSFDSETCVLSIEAQDPECRDEVFWQVIGRRHDPAIKASSCTDAEGRLIVEVEKPPPEEEDEQT